MARLLDISARSRALPLWAAGLLAACSEAVTLEVANPADLPRETASLQNSSIEEINHIEQIDFTAYSIELAQNVGLEIGEAKAASNEKIQTYFKPAKGAEGSAEYLFSELRGEGGNVILATSNGLADDSIKGEELYAVFKDDKLITYGLRQKCWRGDNPDIWQTQFCP